MKIGFLEESEGVRSMARLTIAWMSILATLIVVTTCYAVITKTLTTGEPIVALGGLLLTIVAKGAVAIINRNGPDADK